MPVLYGNSKLIPAPFVRIQKTYQTSQDGKIIGSLFNITVQGTLVADKGSPNSSGVFWTAGGYPSDEIIAETSMHKSLIRKQEAIRRLFATEGLSFEAQPWDGTAPFKCNPRVKSIEFPAGNWFNVLPYSIELEADILYISGTANGEDSGDVVDYKIASATEDWNIEAADEYQRTFRLTHSVSAVGKRFYDDTGTLNLQAWENARSYVLNRIGLGIDSSRLEAEDVLDLTSFQAFNYVRSERVNELTGEYGVTETWLCFDPQGGEKAIEEYEITTRTDGSTGLTNVSVSGTIRGLEVRDNSTYALVSSRYTNASAKWTAVSSSLHTRAQNISGVTLHSTPLNSQIGRNQDSGVITYAYEYNNRRNNVFAGTLSEVISVNYKHPNDVFAVIPIINRAVGPIIQDIGTQTAREKTVTVEIQVTPSTQSAVATDPNTSGAIDTYMGTQAPAGTSVFISGDEESFIPNTGRYFRRLSWTWNLAG